MFINRKSDWNELLKWAAWFVPSSCTSSLLTVSPLGPNTSSNSVANVDGRVCVCARAGVEASSHPHSPISHTLIRLSSESTRSKAYRVDQPGVAGAMDVHRRL